MNTENWRNKHNKGFTLVELIVVLVILAILAAILIPALLGYIDRAREKQDVLDARNLLIATQAELAQLYGTHGDKLQWDEPIITGSDMSDDNGDVDITSTDIAARILQTADMTGDKEPYIFMVAVGSNHDKKSNAKDKTLPLHDKYTVYYACYIKEKGSVPYYYYDGAWTKVNPRAKGTVEQFDAQNRFKSGPYKDKRMQYYLISNQTGLKISEGPFWTYLKETLHQSWNK